MSIRIFEKYYWKRLIRSALAYVKFLCSSHITPEPLNHPNSDFFLWVRLDEIGDYVLWRNFIPLLRQTWPKKKLILCGNVAWKPLWEALDSEHAFDCVWVNKNKWQQSANYQREIIQKIRQYQPALTINLTYSRSFDFDDCVVHLTNSPQRIGVQGDFSSSFSWQARISQHWYTRLLIPPPNIRFDFERNNWILNSLVSSNLSIKFPAIVMPSMLGMQRKPARKTYFVIFPAGRQPYKRWSAANFAAVATELATKTGLSVVIAGGPGEELYTQAVQQQLSCPVIDLTGKTTLTELMALLQDAVALISNDTGAVHLAVALKTPTVVVLNGTHYGRFCPYPIESQHCFRAIYPPSLLNDGLTEPQRWEKYQYRAAFDINTISPTAVLAAIYAIIPTNQNHSS